jgi:hypothetical protein
VVRAQAEGEIATVRAHVERLETELVVQWPPTLVASADRVSLSQTTSTYAATHPCLRLGSEPGAEAIRRFATNHLLFTNGPRP